MAFSSTKGVIQRFYAAWNAQQMEEAAALIAPTFINHVLPPDALQGRGFRVVLVAVCPGRWRDGRSGARVPEGKAPDDA